MLSYVKGASLDDDDHRFDPLKPDRPGNLCDAEHIYLDEVIVDDAGGRSLFAPTWISVAGARRKDTVAG